jgi:hypothetical protein
MDDKESRERKIDLGWMAAILRRLGSWATEGGETRRLGGELALVLMAIAISISISILRLLQLPSLAGF